jgi:hypothetical protein
MRLTILLALALISRAQTVPRLDQISGSPPASSPETAWCPGAPLERLDATTVAIGRQWSAATPCYAHFNLTPPAAIDPISVSTFTAGATVTVTAGATFSDDLYVYLQAPAFNSTTMTRPQRIVVQSKYPSQLQCSGCIVETAGAGTRMFPAFSMPVGLVSVQGGQVHPSLDPIINSHQLYIGADLGVAVRRDGAGLWIELSRADAQAQAQIVQAQMAAGSLAAAQARVMASQPLPVQRLDDLERKFEALQRDYFDVVGRIPASPEDVQQLAISVDAARAAAEMASQNGHDILGSLSMQVEGQIQSMQAEAFNRLILNVDRTAKSGEKCDEKGAVFGLHGRTVVVCDGGKWRRILGR